MGVKIFAYVLALYCFCFVEVYCNEPCILHLKDPLKTPVFRPFIFDLEGKLYPAKNDQVRIPSKTSFALSCQNNFFKNYEGEHKLNVTCNDDTLTVSKDNSVKRFKDLNCDIRLIDEVKNEISSCTGDNEGVFYEYTDVDQVLHVKLAEVCYNYKLDQNKFIRIQYSNTPVPETYTQKTGRNLHRLSTNIGHRVTLLPVYRYTMMEKALKTLLTDESDMAKAPLEAIKLLPKVFFNEQYQDFERFPTNMAALWKTVADGNWQKTLDDIKDFAFSRKGSLEIIFGTHGVLTLPKPNGVETDIFLNGHTVPVPAMVWAAVHDKSNDKAVAIITINNPFIAYDEIKKQTFCESECETIPWLKKLLRNKSYSRSIYGYTFCCKMNKLKIYDLINSKDLLKN